jgi:hypothetical protein
LSRARGRRSKRLRAGPLPKLALLLLILWSAGIYLLLTLSRPEPIAIPPPVAERMPARRPSPAPPTIVEPEAPPPAPPASRRPRIAIIIDDLGNSKSDLEALSRLKGPLTAAILPHAPWSLEAARMARACGHQVILHLPMEPEDYAEHDPGVGALLVDMDQRQFGRQLQSALRAVPYVEGVNNHMGSRLTQARPAMVAVMRAIRASGLFFIDSRTSARTAALAVARELALPSAARDLFLDAEDAGAVEQRLSSLIAIARERGGAIGIGHPRAVTLSVLERELPRLSEREVELVHAGALATTGVDPRLAQRGPEPAPGGGARGSGS